jgi:hypothetical protein
MLHLVLKYTLKKTRILPANRKLKLTALETKTVHSGFDGRHMYIMSSFLVCHCHELKEDVSTCDVIEIVQPIIIYN